MVVKNGNKEKQYFFYDMAVKDVPELKMANILPIFVFNKTKR